MPDGPGLWGKFERFQDKKKKKSRASWDLESRVGTCVMSKWGTMQPILGHESNISVRFLLKGVLCAALYVK